ncbi:hypothetical protein IQ268_04455 [Oculatella sp. LEGE 06141]|uniref:hypothetical protein n=1 Tax=Oculatella sp. LEGE 06141 TaxID=1828648 RepID=UPI001881DEA3|nr:hypothetical protein [Oculatella sp. LEGE 06141]MBE9177833.1 hypothetical protein [Oculatella sp. LEGE 06141]
MITIKTMKQIATCKTIPSFRSSGARGRSLSLPADRARMAAGYQHLLTQESQRQWRSRVWQERNLGTL